MDFSNYHSYNDEELLDVPCDHQNEFGNTPLHHAVDHKPHLVPLMKDHQIRNKCGQTALHLACMHKPSVIHLLGDHQMQENLGHTPLHYLCLYYPRFTPLLKWHEVLLYCDQMPLHLINMYNRPCSHTHVLAKLRRLLRTLPTAYSRLVHGYT